MERFAAIQNTQRHLIEAYLPSNYEVIGRSAAGTVVVCGEDVAGWTLDDYVIPRLRSGGLFAYECDHGDAMELIHNTQ